jgi:hypothetical protein
MSYHTGRIVWHEDTAEADDEEPRHPDRVAAQSFSIKDLNWSDSGKLVVLSQVHKFLYMKFPLFLSVLA